MVGVSIGAHAITMSNGQRVPLRSAGVPADLLGRIATNSPYITLQSRKARVVSPHELFASIVTEAVRSADLEETEPVSLALPGWWGPVATDQVKHAFAEHDVEFSFVNGAEAVVAATRHTSPRLNGTVIVLNLGAELSSAVVVADAGGTPTAHVNPIHVLEEGGAHLDSALLHHLLQGLQELGDAVELTDPRVIASARQALAQSKTLREDLSTSLIETVLPDVPNAAHRLRVLRGELETLAQPWLNDVIATVRAATEQLEDSVTAIIVTGGLSHMPLVSQRLSAELGLETIVAADADSIEAEGAQAMLAARQAHRPPSVLRQFAQRLPRVKLPRRKPASSVPEPVDPEHSSEVDDLLTSIFRSDDSEPAETPEIEKHLQK